MRNETRTIGYIDDSENPLDVEVELALRSSMEENLRRYCQLIASLAAMNGIDVYNYPKDTSIYYIEDDEFQ